MALAQRDEPLLVRIGHHAAERVLQMRHGDDGLDVVVGIERHFQRFDRQARLRTGRNLQRAHAKTFEHLQEAVEGGRFDRDGVAGLGHGAKRKVERLDAAIGGQHFVGRKGHAHTQAAPRSGFAQGVETARRRGGGEQRGLLAQQPHHDRAQRFAGVELGRAPRGGEIDAHLALPPSCDEIGDLRVDAQVLRRGGRDDGRGFFHCRDRQAARSLHEIAGAVARLDPAFAFHGAAQLERGGQADVVRPHQAAQRGQLVAGLERAGMDRIHIARGEFPVEGRRIHWRDALLSRIPKTDADSRNGTITDGRGRICFASYTAWLCLFFGRPDSYDEAIQN